MHGPVAYAKQNDSGARAESVAAEFGYNRAAREREISFATCVFLNAPDAVGSYRYNDLCEDLAWFEIGCEYANEEIVGIDESLSAPARDPKLRLQSAHRGGSIRR